MTTGPEGYAAWRHVATAATLAIAGATDWKLYSPELALLASGSGSASGVHAAAGTYLVVFAAAGHTTTVTAT